MAIHEEVTTLNGVTYGLNTLPATEQLDLFTRLIGYAGAGLEPLGINVDKATSGDLSLGDIVNRTISTDVLAKAFAGLSKKIAEPGTVDVIKRFLAGLQVNKAAVQFDYYFSGQVLTLLKLTWWAIQVNYPDFFGALPAVSRAVGEVVRAQNGSSRPQDSPGS